MVNQISSKSNNPGPGSQRRATLPTALSNQDQDGAQIQGGFHLGAKDELQESMEWQKLLQEEAMQENGREGLDGLTIEELR